MTQFQKMRKELLEKYVDKIYTLEEFSHIRAQLDNHSLCIAYSTIPYNYQGFGELVISPKRKGNHDEPFSIYGYIKKREISQYVNYYTTCMYRCEEVNPKVNLFTKCIKLDNRSILDILKVGDRIIGTALLFREMGTNYCDDESLLETTTIGYKVISIEGGITEKNLLPYKQGDVIVTKIYLGAENGSMLYSLSTQYVLSQYISAIYRNSEILV